MQPKISFPPDILRALERLQFICLDEWDGNNKAYRFQCNQGHVFKHLARSLYVMKGCGHCLETQKLLKLKRKAEEEGSELLTTQWIGAGSAYYDFRCRQDPSHEWQRIYSFAKTNCRCPHCTPRGRKFATDGLRRLQSFARERGGECLSTDYFGITQVHRFRCASGHVWDVAANVVMNSNRWCPQCRGTLEYSIEDARRSAEKHGGLFLSDEYRSVRSFYSWQCSRGHVWKSRYKTILAGSWCPQCSYESRRLDPESLQIAAAARGGKCLSTEYHTSTTKYLWKCAKGHEWKTTLQHIRQGGWCRECIKLTLEDMQQTAAARGGKCLATEYLSTQHKYPWECARGHIWNARFGNVRNGTWCPICALMIRSKPGSAAWRKYQNHRPSE